MWLALGTGATRAAFGALSRYPGVAYAFAIAVATITGVGGLVGYWLVAEHIDFRRLGYRVKWLNANAWAYEERSRAPEGRLLPYIREVRGRGYPELCTIRIASEVVWDREVPAWARGRRNEILDRITNCHDPSRSGAVEFVSRARRPTAG
jgi:hypothetical protein